MWRWGGSCSGAYARRLAVLRRRPACADSGADLRMTGYDRLRLCVLECFGEWRVQGLCSRPTPGHFKCSDAGTAAGVSLDTADGGARQRRELPSSKRS